MSIYDKVQAYHLARLARSQAEDAYRACPHLFTELCEESVAEAQAFEDENDALHEMYVAAHVNDAYYEIPWRERVWRWLTEPALSMVEIGVIVLVARVLQTALEVIT